MSIDKQTRLRTLTPKQRMLYDRVIKSRGTFVNGAELRMAKTLANLGLIRLVVSWPKTRAEPL